MLAARLAHVSSAALRAPLAAVLTAPSMLLRSRAASSAPELPPCDYTPPKYTGPPRSKVEEWRATVLSPSLLTYYRNPLMLVDGHMQYVWDEEGRRYLDALGGIVTVSVGHCHPEVNEAAYAQMGKLQHVSNIYLQPEIGAYAEELTAKLPDNLNCVYFVNSGSEANDLALMMMRVHTGHHDVISLRNAYHGINTALTGLLAHSSWKQPMPQTFGNVHTACPDGYRGPYKRDDPEAGVKYGKDVLDTIQYATCGQVAGFFAETIQGVGGCMPLVDGYLKEAYKHVKAAEGLTLSDEVQCGFGRLGSDYWGFETQGVVPDIVTMAKSIGNGAPLAAVVTSREIAESLTKRVHFNTFGGNPVVCAMGRAVLRVIDDEGLQENSQRVGDRLLAGFEKLKDKYEMIGDVRGSGLLVGMELVHSRETLEPGTTLAADVFERTKELGLLVGRGGLWGHCLRMSPPMCATEADADFMLEVLDQSFAYVQDQQAKSK